MERSCGRQLLSSLPFRGYGSRPSPGRQRKVFSRHHLPEVLQFVCPPKSEGAGKTGCSPHPRSRRLLQKRYAAYEHTGSAETPGLPRAMALRLIRDRPGDPAFCDTIVGSKLSPLANLTPASGRRTQTISPYAKAALVSRDLASIASLPLVCDDGQRPSDGTGWRDSTSDFPISPAIYFYGEGWTYILG